MVEGTKIPDEDNKQRLWVIFDRLLPLLDSLADKFRFVFIVGVLLLVWVVFWLFGLKHYSLTITLVLAAVMLLPLLIVLRFWWAFEELKDLPEIAGQMLGDAKSEIREKVQNIGQQKSGKISVFGVGKGLFSVAAMAREASSLAGSYLSVVTLLNPFMLVLGIVSVLFIILLAIVGLALVFFAF